MNGNLDIKILGWLVAGVGATQLVPLAAAPLFQESGAPYAWSAAVSILVGLCLALSARPTDQTMRPRDGFLVVGFGWILASIFGALPYLLSDQLGPADALFESVAGFTTTGATVISQLDQAPRALLLYRAVTQWLGGMGIIVFAVAILPLLGIGGMQLFRAETPSPTANKLRPRVAETARRLLFIYVGFTVAEVIALILADLSVYEAICHALTNVSTAGFSTRDASIGGFASPLVEWIVIVFMVLGGINFALHYRLITGDPGALIRDVEIRYFLSVLVVAALAVTWLLKTSGMAGEAGFRTALFQVASIITTTGYTTADYNAWPALAGIILLLLMVLGGMTGSTSGGVKDLRVILAFRVVRNVMARSLHPRAVTAVKYAGEKVQPDILTQIWAFLTAYFALAAVAAAIVASAGYDLVTSVSAALSAVSNVGPAFGAVGPSETFHHFPGYVKVVLSFCMIAGRLDVFTLLVLFSPGFWKR